MDTSVPLLEDYTDNLINRVSNILELRPDNEVYTYDANESVHNEPHCHWSADTIGLADH
ncbi:hypothetical protein DPMN_112309 [Dreissena polymorpha]|uniref:Uncharacterized protein n=1 Tax=Dreissena polymorpha TaxID=45954 RepID=A0A9D4QQI9_DREPO|nr:hypothetical protein DPMN_112309 [Dreissena polymorpha]